MNTNILNPLATALGNKGMINVARNTRRIPTKANKNFLASTGPNMNTLNPTFDLKKNRTPSLLTIRTPANSPSTTPANSPMTPVSTTANMGRFSSTPSPATNTRRNNNRVAFVPQQVRERGGRKSRKHRRVNKNKRS